MQWDRLCSHQWRQLPCGLRLSCQMVRESEFRRHMDHLRDAKAHDELAQPAHVLLAGNGCTREAISVDMSLLHQNT